MDNPVEPMPSVPTMPSNTPVKNKSLMESLKGNKRIMLVGGGVLLLSLCAIIMCILFALGSFGSIFPDTSESDTTQVPTEIPDDTTTETTVTPTPDTEDLPHVVFYQLENTIYSYNVETDTTALVYTFEPGDFSDVSNTLNTLAYATFIDSENLGFYICDVVTGNYNCKLYHLEVDSGDLNELEDRPSTDFVLQSGFLDENNFVYFYEDTSVTNGRQVLVGTILGSGGTEEGFLLDELSVPGPSAYGRGGFAADDSDIRYSPDGNYLAFIQTSNVVNGLDFNIRMYDMTSKGSLTSLPVIEDATHPFWIDNSHIAYRIFSNEDTISDEGDIAIYNISTNSTTKLNIPVAKRAVTSFSVIDNKYLFSTGDFEIYVFNSSTGNGSVIVNDGANPVWIDAEHIIYNPVEECDDCFDGYNYLPPVVYNITENMVVKTLDSGIYAFETAYAD